MVIPVLQVLTWKCRSLVRPQPDASSSESDGYKNLISSFDRLRTVEGNPRGDPECQIWQRLVTEMQPILFVGESHTRALPMALVAMRESFQDIWATSLELQAVPDKALDHMLKELEGRMQKAHTSGRPVVFFQCCLCVLTISYVTGIYQEWADPNRSFKQNRVISKPFTESGQLKNLFLQADATRLKQFFDKHKGSPSSKNIWFQCPWRSGDTNSLLLEFLTSAANVQQFGDVILLGLTTHEKYHHQYGLDEFLVATKMHGYRRFTNKTFIRQCMSYGYQHITDDVLPDIHKWIENHHITYVFINRLVVHSV
jgi:hypothetical protein